jgi:hypothetical protein
MGWLLVSNFVEFEHCLAQCIAGFHWHTTALHTQLIAAPRFHCSLQLHFFVAI